MDVKQLGRQPVVGTVGPGGADAAVGLTATAGQGS